MSHQKRHRPEELGIMRLLMHGYNYAPELTGIGRYSGEMGTWLASRGHRVTVLTAPPYYPEWQIHEAYRGRGWRREWLDGVEVLRAPMYVPSRVTGKSRLLLELSFGASSIYWWPHIFARRWDAVIAICPPLIVSFIPLLLAREQGIPFILHFQDLQLDVARKLGIIRNRALFSILERLDRFFLNRAEAVTAISNAMLARLGRNGDQAHHFHLFPNWADLEKIRPGPRMNSLRRELGLDSEVLVLYAGSMGEKQGLEIVLESARFTRERLDIRYVLAGDGATKSRIMKQTQDQNLKNVTFLPVQSEERFPLLLAAGDIHLVIQKEKAADLVMPSKLTNILAAGRPFIATAFPGTELALVTDESQAGLRVPPEDGEALARAIVELAEKETVRQEMGARGRRYAESRLSREAILTGFEDFLLQLHK